MPSAKRPLYPGQFTWRLDDSQPAKRKKRNVDILRINSATYRQRLKNDNDALTTNAEKEMLAVAAER